MENIKTISILMIVLCVVLVVISISGGINDKEEISQNLSIWKPDPKEINKTIENIRNTLDRL